MKVLRTPDERFEQLPGFPFEPNYTTVGGLRMHYLDEGPPEADPLLLLHGEPTWSYLYRKMIPVLTAAGHRVIAPDLIGFGRSDKPAAIADYSYDQHLSWVRELIEDLNLERAVLVAQDWGSLLGLRLLTEIGDRFQSAVIANGFLPSGDQPVPRAFELWQFFARWSPYFPIGRIVDKGCTTRLDPEIRAAYDAPFPSARFKAGTRAFPRLVPTRPNDPSSQANRRAWKILETWDKPFFTAFSNRDPIFRGADKVLQQRIPGASGIDHAIIDGGGHFLQEDRGEQLARSICGFLAGQSHR